MGHWLRRLTAGQPAGRATNNEAPDVPIRLALGAAALGMILGTAGTPAASSGDVRINPSTLELDPVVAAEADPSAFDRSPLVLRSS